MKIFNKLFTLLGTGGNSLKQMGTLWNCRWAPFETVREHSLTKVSTFWNNWALFQQGEHFLEQLGTLWTRWALFGTIGHSLNKVSTIWNNWALFEQGEHYLEQLGILWTRWALFGAGKHLFINLGYLHCYYQCLNFAF